MIKRADNNGSWPLERWLDDTSRIVGRYFFVFSRIVVETPFAVVISRNVCKKYHGRFELVSAFNRPLDGPLFTGRSGYFVGLIAADENKNSSIPAN